MAPSSPQQARKGAARRFVWRRGKLRGLPESPGKFLTSDCLSLGARLRVLFEPWAKGAPPGDDESVRAFAARRIGKGAADVLVDAFVTGIFAGDPSRLSVASAFPRLRAVEAEHGSLIKGFKAKKRAGPGGTLTSFEGGMEVLIRALAEWLDVRLEAQQERQSPLRRQGSGGYRLAEAPRERKSPAYPSVRRSRSTTQDPDLPLVKSSARSRFFGARVLHAGEKSRFGRSTV